ncbi:MAG: LytTR family DNA-binding domain-containing protein [Eubacteriales bacterium]|nr:LytTR family DNA-binding domain-containing protein [Eubacteriales bacterium]
MRVRIELTDENQAEEVVVYCKAITPEVELLINRLGEKEHSKTPLSFYKGETQYYLVLQEILFFEIDNERLFAHTVDDSFEVKARLYEIETILPPSFTRISRAAIVNTTHIRSIQKGLTGVSHIAFRQSKKEIYGSRLYYPLLSQKMEERYSYENK